MPRRHRKQPNTPKDASSNDLMKWWLRSRGDIDDVVDRDFERSCTQKAAYTSETEARAHAAMNDMSGILHTYHCRYCDMWHLTKRST
jgi:hypothetical protein